jgi:hypothetical protein
MAASVRRVLTNAFNSNCLCPADPTLELGLRHRVIKQTAKTCGQPGGGKTLAAEKSDMALECSTAFTNHAACLGLASTTLHAAAIPWDPSPRCEAIAAASGSSQSINQSAHGHLSSCAHGPHPCTDILHGYLNPGTKGTAQRPIPACLHGIFVRPTTAAVARLFSASQKRQWLRTHTQTCIDQGTHTMRQT